MVKQLTIAWIFLSLFQVYPATTYVFAGEFLSVGTIDLTMHIHEGGRKVKSVQTLCTATLIDAKTVITSAECVYPLLYAKHSDTAAYIDSKNSYFVIDYNEGFKISSRLEKILIYHPSINIGESEFDRFDLSASPVVLLFLTDPIYDVDPAKLYESQEIDLESQSLTMVTYGGEDEGPIPGTIKQVFKGAEGVFKANSLVFQWQYSYDTKKPYLTKGEHGAPVFIKDPKSRQWLLLGIAISHDSEHYYAAAIGPVHTWLSEEKGQQEASFRRTNADPINFWSQPEIWQRDIFRKVAKLKSETSLSTDEEESVDKKSQILKRISPSSWDLSKENLMAPDNTSHKQWSVVFDREGRLVLSQSATIDDLIIDHPAFSLIIPESYKIGKKLSEFEQDIQSLVDDENYKESIGFRDLFVGVDKEDELVSLKGLLESRTVKMKQGLMDVSGELHALDMTMSGGFLVGEGKLVVAQRGLIQKGGVIAPGYSNQFAKLEPKNIQLEIWGNFEQSGYIRSKETGELAEKVGTLRFNITVNDKNKMVYDRLKVIGSAKIGGNLQIFIKPNLDMHNKTISLFEATQGIEGEFAQVEVSGGYITKLDYVGSQLKITFIDPKRGERQPFEAYRAKGILKKYPKILSHETYKLEGDIHEFVSMQLQGGELRGHGYIKMRKDALYNCGTLKVENGTEPALMYIDGDYEQCKSSDPEALPELGGKLVLTINDPSAEVAGDRLKISQTAYLGGSLVLVALNPARLDFGQRIKVLEAKNIVGAFDRIILLNSKLTAKPIFTEHGLEVELSGLRFEDLASSEDLSAARILDKIQKIKTTGPTAPLLKVLQGNDVQKGFLSSLPHFQERIELNHETDEQLSVYALRFTKINASDREQEFKILFERYMKALAEQKLIKLIIQKEGESGRLISKLREGEKEVEESRRELDNFLELLEK